MNDSAIAVLHGESHMNSQQKVAETNLCDGEWSDEHEYNSMHAIKRGRDRPASEKEDDSSESRRVEDACVDMTEPSWNRA